MINTSNSLNNDKFRKEYVDKNISEGMQLSGAEECSYQMQFFKLQLASNATYSHQNDLPQIFRLILFLLIPQVCSCFFCPLIDPQSTA